MENKDIIKTDDGRLHQQEITAHRTAYMIAQPWFCECCHYNYRLTGKWKHLKTKKHKINSGKY